MSVSGSSCHFSYSLLIANLILVGTSFTFLIVYGVQILSSSFSLFTILYISLLLESIILLVHPFTLKQKSFFPIIKKTLKVVLLSKSQRCPLLTYSCFLYFIPVLGFYMSSPIILISLTILAVIRACYVVCHVVVLLIFLTTVETTLESIEWKISSLKNELARVATLKEIVAQWGWAEDVLAYLSRSFGLWLGVVLASTMVTYINGVSNALKVAARQKTVSTSTVLVVWLWNFNLYFLLVLCIKSYRISFQVSFL